MRDEHRRAFRYLWFGQTISYLGDRFFYFTIVINAYVIYHSSLLVSSLFFVMAIPPIIVAPLLGPYINRGNRKAIMQLLNIASCAGAFLFAFVWESPGASVGTVFFLAISSSVFSPTLRTELASRYDRTQLVRLNSLMNSSRKFVDVMGPLIAAVSLTYITVEQAVWVDSITFIISLLCLIPMPKGSVSEEPRTDQKPLWSGTLISYRLLLHERQLMYWAVILSLVGFSVALNNVAIVPFAYSVAHRIHRGTDLTYGLMLSAMALGMMMSSLLLSRKPDAKFAGSFSLAIAGISVGIMPLVSRVLPIITTRLFYGFGLTASLIIGTSFVQSYNTEYKAQLITAVESVGDMFHLMGIFIGGILVTKSLTAAFTISGLLLLCSMLISRVTGIFAATHVPFRPGGHVAK